MLSSTDVPIVEQVSEKDGSKEIASVVHTTVGVTTVLAAGFVFQRTVKVHPFPIARG